MGSRRDCEVCNGPLGARRGRRAEELDALATHWIEVGRAIAVEQYAARVALRPDGRFAWHLEVEYCGLTVRYRAEEVLGVFAVERVGAGVVGECVGLGRVIELVLAEVAR